MEDNVKVIHFLIKRRGVQSLVFVQITFENRITNFYSENSEVDIKTIVANLQPLLVSNVFAYLHILIQLRSVKKCLYETSLRGNFLNFREFATNLQKSNSLKYFSKNSRKFISYKVNFKCQLNEN